MPWRNSQVQPPKMSEATVAESRRWGKKATIHTNRRNWQCHLHLQAWEKPRISESWEFASSLQKRDFNQVTKARVICHTRRPSEVNGWRWESESWTAMEIKRHLKCQNKGISTVGTEWNQSQRDTVCSGSSNTGGVGYPRLLEPMQCHYKPIYLQLRV